MRGVGGLGCCGSGGGLLPWKAVGEVRSGEEGAVGLAEGGKGGMGGGGVVIGEGQGGKGGDGGVVIGEGVGGRKAGGNGVA